MSLMTGVADKNRESEHGIMRRFGGQNRGGRDNQDWFLAKKRTRRDPGRKTIQRPKQKGVEAAGQSAGHNNGDRRAREGVHGRPLSEPARAVGGRPKHGPLWYQTGPRFLGEVLRFSHHSGKNMYKKYLQRLTFWCHTNVRGGDNPAEFSH